MMSPGSQQAINMLKEQNRLLTKVSRGRGGGDVLGGVGKGTRNSLIRWDGTREVMTGSGKCSFNLARLGHPRKGCVGCMWRPSGTQLCPAVSSCLLGESVAGMGHS